MTQSTSALRIAYKMFDLAVANPTHNGYQGAFRIALDDLNADEFEHFCKTQKSRRESGEFDS